MRRGRKQGAILLQPADKFDALRLKRCRVAHRVRSYMQAAIRA
jgi:hypothetical protein